jgi:hypothetical protein
VEFENSLPLLCQCVSVLHIGQYDVTFPSCQVPMSAWGQTPTCQVSRPCVESPPVG